MKIITKTRCLDLNKTIRKELKDLLNNCLKDISSETIFTLRDLLENFIDEQFGKVFIVSDNQSFHCSEDEQHILKIFFDETKAKKYADSLSISTDIITWDIDL
jgi:hypothetical protein